VDKRRLERISLPRVVVVRSATLGIADAAAVLRDISASGAFCYTLLPLVNGEVVEMFVNLRDSLGSFQMSFTGKVARVERGVTDNSLGIAVSFTGFKELNGSSGSA
jgi:PilZ domain